MLFYFMLLVSKTLFMILTQCCHFHVLLMCTVWRPLGWMTAFVQNFAGDGIKDKDCECYFVNKKLKFSLWKCSDGELFLLYSNKIIALC